MLLYHDILSFYSVSEGHSVKAVSKAKHSLLGYDFFTPIHRDKICINIYFYAYTHEEFTFKGILKEKKTGRRGEGDFYAVYAQKDNAKKKKRQQP